MDTVLSSTFVDDHAVKLGVLYCDRIVIPDDAVGFIEPDEPITDKRKRYRGTIREVYRTFSDEIEAELKPLFSEGILVRSESARVNDTSAFQNAFDDIFGPLLEDDRIDEALMFHLSLVGAGASEMNLTVFYALLAASAYQTSIKYDVPILTDNMIVDTVLLNFMEKGRLAKYGNLSKLKTAFLTHQVMKEFLPDIGNASLEDVLEVRYKFRDELDSFRNKMSTLSDKIRSNPWEPNIKHEIERIVEVEIKPETANLKSALRRSSLQLVSNVFHNLKDTRTYIPFVGTVLGHVEPSIAALASLGIAGFAALQDTIVERREIRDTSGLLFLLKGPRKLSKMRRS